MNVRCGSGFEKINQEPKSLNVRQKLGIRKTFKTFTLSRHAEQLNLVFLDKNGNEVFDLTHITRACDCWVHWTGSQLKIKTYVFVVGSNAFTQLLLPNIKVAKERSQR